MNTDTTEAHWQAFILEHGAKAKYYDLAAVVGRSVKEVLRVRDTGACKKQHKGKNFSELFSLFHGRQPGDEEYPAPVKYHLNYVWNTPELALLASLVGRLSVSEIAVVLTNRTMNAVQVQTNKIGLQIKDVVGGISPAEAGREIGSLPIVHQMIHSKQIKVQRIGRLIVIPYAEWQAWKAKRTFPPVGYVKLSSIRTALAIKSDKLPEFASLGYIPTAIRCNTYGATGSNTQFGTWFIDSKVAEQMVADRRAGRPMPWHGKPLKTNLGVSYKLWSARKHPTNCETCASIWGENGAPTSYEDYEKRYPPLAHGAKRHLTMKWNPGLTIEELSEKSLRSYDIIKRAIKNAVLDASKEGRTTYITKTEAARWIARKCPSGDNAQSCISLETAQKVYWFSEAELNAYIADGTLKTVTKPDADKKLVTYVMRYQCAKLRAEIGFSEAEAAKRVGVSIPKLRKLLEGVNWRKKEGIPLSAVQAVIKRLQSQRGYTVEEAAKELDTSEQWVKKCVADGLVKVVQANWDARRVYITKAAMKKLKAFKENPVKIEHLNDDWLRVSEAAKEAGVVAATIAKWAKQGLLFRKGSNIGWRYHREAVRAQAREYWKTVRFARLSYPSWLASELGL